MLKLTQLFNKKRLLMLLLTIFLLIGSMFAHAYIRTFGRVQLEFDIQQDKELILFSDYAEPPQFAIWLEDPDTGRFQTVFVTHRSAQGQWDGKSECPGSLPLWFEIFKREFSTDTLPGISKTAPIAITGATPQAEHFKIRAEVPAGSNWICWIEVNLAGDYNEHFNTASGNPNAIIDESGQSSIVYKVQISCIEGTVLTPQIAGYINITKDYDQMIQPLEGITTAKDIFKSIKIKVIRPNAYLFNWTNKHKNSYTFSESASSNR